jgi:hypothetical protein
MTPNKEIPDEKKEKIPILCEKYNKGYVAKKLGVHRDTVKKYLNESRESLNI